MLDSPIGSYRIWPHELGFLPWSSKSTKETSLRLTSYCGLSSVCLLHQRCRLLPCYWKVFSSMACPLYIPESRLAIRNKHLFFSSLTPLVFSREFRENAAWWKLYRRFQTQRFALQWFPFWHPILGHHSGACTFMDFWNYFFLYISHHLWNAHFTLFLETGFF